MPSATGSRRRTRDELEDDNSETSSTPIRDGESSKRPRLSHEGVNGVSDDGFHPGSIIRVLVENFVTYEKAEFFPGPNLNMVIGPNGTGKSSLVCAICLGLGYSPKHLGRAGSVKEFVKNGKDIATIEIELQKRPQDHRNYVIRVQIRREQNSQKWWLNGKEASHKAIQKLMQTLKIQVDNLCQFLPQDRVVEFAACTPVDLLHETLRAAAPEEMLEWQGSLQQLHKDKKELGEAVGTYTETLKNLESRQQGLQADVDRIREREEIERKVRDLKSALIVARYNETRTKLSEAKAQKKAAEKALRDLERETGPSVEAIKKKQLYSQKVKAQIAPKDKLVRDAEAEASRLLRLVQEATEKVAEYSDKVAAEHTGFDEKKKELASSRQKITTLQADQRNKPPEFNGADWNQRVRAQEHTQRDLYNERRELDTRASELRTQGSAKRAAMTKIQEDMKAFDTQEGQQLSLMKRNFPEVSTAWDWIQQHQDAFEREVFGPPMVSCSIKDERYSDQVQSLLQLDDFTCITAQTKNDYKTLTNQLYKEMSLSVVIRTCAHPLSSFKPPLTAQEAMSAGLDGFSIDFLDGPEPVLAMLCSEKGLHRSGVSLREHSDAQYESLVQSGTISQWAAGKHSYLVRRRKEYGPQAMTTVTRNIPPGRFWTSQPVDSHEKVEMTRRLGEIKDDFEVLKAENKSLGGKREEIELKLRDIETEIDTIKAEKGALQKEYQKWQALPNKIATEESKKVAIEQAMRDARVKLADLQYEWDEAVLRRAEAALKHADCLGEIGEAHQLLLDIKVQAIEAESDVDGLKLRNVRIMELLEEEKQNVDQTRAEVSRLLAEGSRLSSVVQDLMQESDERRELLSNLQEGKTPETITFEIDAEEAKLELIHTANPNVVRDFERRALEIERLQARMEQSNEDLRSLTTEIDGIMSKWEPELDRLVSKINDAFAYNFEQISCAGEVRVHKDQDFDLWAMDIMVKFRANEELQQLNAHRQSGGERAVSTIFYLMALQSMAQSPFRVVDEINQGMDPRNERMVHERMVEIACREHTSQYFLITPKLLSGLRYDPKMRVLCIASGEHMPTEGRKLDFRRCLKIQKHLLAGA